MYGDGMTYPRDKRHRGPLRALYRPLDLKPCVVDFGSGGPGELDLIGVGRGVKGKQGDWQK